MDYKAVRLGVGQNRWGRFCKKAKESAPYIVVSGLVTLFIIAYLFHRIFITVPPGHAGVHFSWLGGGTDVNNVYGEGLHVIAPWNTLHLYDVRVQEIDEQIDV